MRTVLCWLIGVVIASATVIAGHKVRLTVRLTNWDAARVAVLVKTGTPVILK